MRAFVEVQSKVNLRATYRVYPKYKVRASAGLQPILWCEPRCSETRFAFASQYGDESRDDPASHTLDEPHPNIASHHFNEPRCRRASQY